MIPLLIKMTGSMWSWLIVSLKRWKVEWFSLWKKVGHKKCALDEFLRSIFYCFFLPFDSFWRLDKWSQQQFLSFLFYGDFLFEFHKYLSYSGRVKSKNLLFQDRNRQHECLKFPDKFVCSVMFWFEKYVAFKREEAK